MNTNQTANIHSIATRFASACALVARAQVNGQVSAARGNANDKTLKVSTVHESDTSAMAPDDLAALKKALRLYNAGHAFQTAFSANIALVGECASDHGKALADLEAKAKTEAEKEAPGVVVEMPAAPAVESTKKKKEQKIA